MKGNMDVIQIYKSEIIFTKGNYTSENRENFWSLSMVDESEIEYLNEGVLFLPIEYQSTFNFHGCELVILIDGLGFGSNSKVVELKVFRGVESPKEFGLFKIQKVRPDTYELSLNFRNNSWIGVPKRNNHKICDLQVEQIIRYQLNGKSDFTSSGRKQRSFYEFDYHFRFVGQAASVEFRKVEALPRIRHTRTENFKFINERKLLR